MRPDSADPRRWLAYARSDLALVREGRHNADVFLEALCYHCQQAVEKSLKAVLIAHALDSRASFADGMGLCPWSVNAAWSAPRCLCSCHRVP